MRVVADGLAEDHAEVVALLLQLVDPPPLRVRPAGEAAVAVLPRDVPHDGDRLRQLHVAFKVCFPIRLVLNFILLFHCLSNSAWV